MERPVCDSPSVPFVFFFLRRPAGFQENDEHVAKEMTASALSTMRSRWLLHRKKTHSVCRVVCSTTMFQGMVEHMAKASCDASRVDATIPRIVEETSNFSTTSRSEFERS